MCLEGQMGSGEWSEGGSATRLWLEVTCGNKYRKASSPGSWNEARPAMLKALGNRVTTGPLPGI